VIVGLAIFVERRLVTDRPTKGWTDRQTHDDIIYRASITSRGKKRQNHEKSRYLPNFQVWGLLYSSLPRLGPNLARESRPMVYCNTSNSTVNDQCRSRLRSTSSCQLSPPSVQLQNRPLVSKMPALRFAHAGVNNVIFINLSGEC